MIDFGDCVSILKIVDVILAIKTYVAITVDVIGVQFPEYSGVDYCHENERKDVKEQHLNTRVTKVSRVTP